MTHQLHNIDPESSTAICEFCGIGVPIKWTGSRRNGRWTCDSERRKYSENSRAVHVHGMLQRIRKRTGRQATFDEAWAIFDKVFPDEHCEILGHEKYADESTWQLIEVMERQEHIIQGDDGLRGGKPTALRRDAEIRALKSPPSGGL